MRSPVHAAAVVFGGLHCADAVHAHKPQLTCKALHHDIGHEARRLMLRPRYELGEACTCCPLRRMTCDC